MLRVSAHVRRGGGTRTLTCAAEVVARDEEPPPLLPPPSPLSGSKSTASPTTSCGVSIAKAHVRSKKCAAGWLCVKAANRGSHHPIIRSRTFRNDHSTNRLLHASDSAQRCDGHHCRSFWLARWPSNSRVAGDCTMWRERRETTAQQTVRLGKELYAQSQHYDAQRRRTKAASRRTRHHRRHGDDLAAVSPSKFGAHLVQNEELGAAAGTWRLGASGITRRDAPNHGLELVMDSSPARAPFRLGHPMAYATSPPKHVRRSRSPSDVLLNISRPAASWGPEHDDETSAGPSAAHSPSARDDYLRSLREGRAIAGYRPSASPEPTGSPAASNTRRQPRQQRRRSGGAPDTDGETFRGGHKPPDQHANRVIRDVRHRRRSSTDAGTLPPNAAGTGDDDDAVRVANPLLDFDHALKDVGRRQALQEQWVAKDAGRQQRYSSPLVEAEMRLHRYVIHRAVRLSRVLLTTPLSMRLRVDSASAFALSKGLRHPNELCTAVAFETLEALGRSLSGHRSLFARLRQVLLHAVYSEVPQPALMDQDTFEACFHSVPHFSEKLQTVESHMLVAERYNAVRKRLEAIVVRRAQGFTKWAKYVAPHFAAVLVATSPCMPQAHQVLPSVAWMHA